MKLPYLLYAVLWIYQPEHLIILFSITSSSFQGLTSQSPFISRVIPSGPKTLALIIIVVFSVTFFKKFSAEDKFLPLPVVLSPVTVIFQRSILHTAVIGTSGGYLAKNLFELIFTLFELLDTPQ